MRKIAANYVMPVSSPPLKNGIVVIDDEGVILQVIDTGGKLRESSSLEFYRGIITPGFVLPWYRAGVQADSSAESAFRDLDRMLFRQGIKGIGMLERKAGHFAEKKESPVTYHTILELCPGKDDDVFEAYQQGIDHISGAWNEFNQACSVSCCTDSLMESDIAEYILKFSITHQLIIPLEDSEKWPLSEQLDRLKKLMERVSEEPPEGMKRNAHLVLIQNRPSLPATSAFGLSELLITLPFSRPKENPSIMEAMFDMQELSARSSLLDVLPEYTINAAEALFEDNLLGSLEPGKTPGLNLVSDLEPGTFKLTGESTFRVLI